MQRLTRRLLLLTTAAIPAFLVPLIEDDWWVDRAHHGDAAAHILWP